MEEAEITIVNFSIVETSMDQFRDPDIRGTVNVPCSGNKASEAFSGSDMFRGGTVDKSTMVRFLAGRWPRGRAKRRCMDGVKEDSTALGWSLKG